MRLCCNIEGHANSPQKVRRYLEMRLCCNGTEQVKPLL